MKQNKHAFNGGIIGQELWSRNDLQRYHSSCKQLNNMVVTAQGGVKRRDPIQLLSKIEIPAEVNTVDMHKHYRMIPFVFSATDTFQIILTPTHIRVFKHTPDPVYGSTGTLVKAIPAPYLANINLSEINFQQSNDVIYLVHNDLQPKRIERRSDTDWRVVDVTFNGGPYLPINGNQNNVMTFNLPTWSATTTYSTGNQVVKPNIEKTINGTATTTYWKSGPAHFSWSKPKKYFLDQIPMDTSGLNVGDSISIKNAGRLTGTWEIQEIVSGAIKINSGVIAVWEREDDDGSDTHHYYYYVPPLSQSNSFGSLTPPAPISITNGTATKYGEGLITTYESIVDNNINHALTDTTNWKVKPTFTDELIIKSNFNVFTADSVGSSIGIEQSRQTTFVSGSFNAQGNKSGITPAFGSVTLTTENGIWGGSLQLEESRDNGETWSLLGSINSGSKYNGTITREIERTGTVIRVRMDQWKIVPDHNACKWKLEIANVGNEATLQVLEFVDQTTVKVRPLDYIISNKPTSNWKLGAFSKINGYPAAICIHEERLFFAGTKKKPSTLYGSKVDDWTDFSSSSYETSPLTFTLASDNVNKIRWMVSKKQLLVGTDTSEWVVSNGDQNKVLSGVNLPSVRKQTDKGSSHLQAMSDNSQVFFIQRDSKQLQSTQFSYEADSYQTKHISILAPDIAGENGFVNVSVQRVPSTVMWLTKSDGTLVSFTHDEENQVQGFSNHNINAPGATIIGTCVIPDDHSDVVYVLYYHNHVLYYGVMSDQVTMDHSVRFNANPSPIWQLTTVNDPAVGNRVRMVVLKDTKRDLNRVFKIHGKLWREIMREDFAVKVKDGFKLEFIREFTRESFDQTEQYKVNKDMNVYAEYYVNKVDGTPLVIEDVNKIPYDQFYNSWNALHRGMPTNRDPEYLVYDTVSTDVGNKYTIFHHNFATMPVSYGGFEDLTNGFNPIDTYLNPSWKVLNENVPIVPAVSNSLNTFAEFTTEHPGKLVFKKSGLNYDANNGINFKSLEIGVPVSYLLNPTVYHADQNSPRTSVIHTIYLYLVNSVGGEISVDGGKTWATIKYRNTSDKPNEVVPFSGVKEIKIGSGYREEMEVMVRGTTPHKIHITNIGIEYDISN